MYTSGLAAETKGAELSSASPVSLFSSDAGSDFACAVSVVFAAAGCFCAEDESVTAGLAVAGCVCAVDGSATAGLSVAGCVCTADGFVLEFAAAAGSVAAAGSTAGLETTESAASGS